MPDVNNHSHGTNGARGPWSAIILAPLVWMAQGAAAWYVVGRACPAGARHVSLVTARAIIAAITLVAVTVTILALARSVRALRTRRGPPETAEQWRFVASLGLVAGVVLTLGVILAGLPAVLIHACGEGR